MTEITDTATTPTDTITWIWRIELARDVVDCAQFAKYEARPIMPAPERDMVMADEELNA